MFDDDEWIRSLTEAQAITADIPDERITHDQSEVDPKKVRLIQVGDFKRKSVSRRLLALSEGAIAALTAPMRQLGVRFPRGTEARAIFPPAPLRRVDVRNTGHARSSNQS